MIAVLIWLGLGNFSSTLKVDRKGLSIGTVEKAQFNDYVSVDGQVVPISVVQISSEEGGIVLEKVVDEGAHVNKGVVIVKLSNSNLDLEILNAESELAEKQDMLRNTQISMEQDRLNNSNEELSLSQDVITKRRSASVSGAPSCQADRADTRAAASTRPPSFRYSRARRSMRGVPLPSAGRRGARRTSWERASRGNSSARPFSRNSPRAGSGSRQRSRRCSRGAARRLHFRRAVPLQEISRA